MGSFLRKLDISNDTYFLVKSVQKTAVQIIKHEWTPEIYEYKFYCIVIILYRMHTKKPKTYPSQSSWNLLDAMLLFPMWLKRRARYQNTEPSNQRNMQIATREQIELHAPISKRFLLPNITYILIIHSGPVTRTVPIKNHGQDSSTSPLESIRFKYLRLK